LVSGRGGLVDSSLLRSGLFCMSSVLALSKPDPSPTVENLSQFLTIEKDNSTHIACIDGNIGILGERINHKNYNENEGDSRIDGLSNHKQV